MSATQSSRESALLTEINVTPLVDVVLVLLILMMVTATTLATKAIAVELPKAQAPDAETGESPVVVALDESGAMFLDRQPATEAAIRARARAKVESGRQASAVLAADGRARHQSVVHVLQILRSEHVTKIAIVVRSESAE